MRSSTPSPSGRPAEEGRQERRSGERRRTDRRERSTGGAAWRDLHRPARALIYLLIALALIIIYQDASFLVSKVLSVLLLFVFAAIIAMLLNPLADALERLRFLPGGRGTAVLTLNLALTLGLALVLAVLIPSVVAQSAAFGDGGPRLLRRVQGALDGIEPYLHQRGVPLHGSVPRGLGTGV